MSKESTHTSILHDGVVVSVYGRRAAVRIRQSQACSSCVAVSACRAVRDRETIVSAVCAGGFTPLVGERVVVEATVGQGLRAALLAYAVPLVLMVGTLSLAVALLHSEAAGALVALAALALYYVALHFMGSRLHRTLSFEVKRAINQNN